eukprot:COSAG05_NODE_10866_length_542_cov_0.656885_1_plen_50_part_10
MNCRSAQSMVEMWPELNFPLETKDGLDWFFYTQAFYWAVATISVRGRARA